MRLFRKIALIVLVIGLLTYAGVRYYYNLPSKTPELAIKKYIFFNGKLLESYDIKIKKTNIVDRNYGILYLVEGFYAEPGRTEVRFFYLKQKNKGWYVFSAGTGP